MKNKFNFNDVVKIVSSKSSHKEINGELGVIKGMVQCEETAEWIYGVAIYKQEGLIWRVKEDSLVSTGEKADSKEFMSSESVKVRVDPKTGKGKIIDDN